MKFTDRTALVTGGGSGLGRATALAFAELGANVAIADIDANANEETLALLRQKTDKAFAHTTDVSNEESVKSLVRETIARFNSLDAAINNAGVEQQPQSFLEANDAVFDSVMNVNLRGVWYCMKAELDVMVPRGRGAIVNVTSITDSVGAVGNPIYVASKHAVLGLTRSAALEFAKCGIRINAVSPAGIRTRLYEEVEKRNPEFVARGLALHPIGRIASAEEVARTICFLASDDASYILGHSLKVDGGYTAC